MNKSNKIRRVLTLLVDSGSEIVSYGLAPNPNGFCYERGNSLSKVQEKELNNLLNSLSSKEENILKITVGL